MNLLRDFLLSVLLTMLAFPAQAASSINMGVSATVVSVGYCRVIDHEDITFGPLNPLDPQNVQAAGSVRVRCYGFSGNFTVGASQSTSSPLYLVNGSNAIPYTLDLPTSVSGPIYFIGSLSIPVTAHIQGSDYRFAPAGSYADTVTVQINP